MSGDTKNAYFNNNLIDMKNKIIFCWTPRAGCSCVCKCFYDMIGLLDTANNYNNFIHYYRIGVWIHQNININNFDEVENIESYKIIKFITNPYTRAVSVYGWAMENSCNFDQNIVNKNLSFRVFMQKLLNGEFKLWNDLNYHAKPQFVSDEDKYVTEYIKIDKNETLVIKKYNKETFEINISNYNSPHHAKKTNCSAFCGDTKFININSMPKSYKLFYDEQIKLLVEQYYADDLKNYNYTFDEMR